MAEQRKKAVFMVCYFGKLPNYFPLWVKTAQTNTSFDFYIFTDQTPRISDNSNVHIFPMTFAQMQERIKAKLGNGFVIRTPYKLCDYKVAYGLLFEEYISAYPFWGFCDIDTLLGDLDYFITDEVLDHYDKLFRHGHMILMRNTERMRRLFLEQYENVMDYRFAYSTNHVTHFDESATVAYAQRFDKSIRHYAGGCFLDSIWNSYTLRKYPDPEEKVCVWKDGKLFMYWFAQGELMQEELMYLHLQKRTMSVKKKSGEDVIVARRNELIMDDHADISAYVAEPVDPTAEAAFAELQKQKRKKDVKMNIKSGALKTRLYLLKHRSLIRD